MHKDKDIVLFVNAVRPATFAAFRKYTQETGRVLQPVVIVDKQIQRSITARNAQESHTGKVKVLSADFDSPVSVKNALKPYMDRILTITSQYENSILELKKLIPYLPYIPSPTETSLEWATEKKFMRQMLEAYDPTLVPKYLEIADNSKNSIATIEAAIAYPMIVKPSGLEGSLLVTLVKNREELNSTIEHVAASIQAAYDKWIKRQVPAILVEEFMDGQMYSIDTYVASDGTCRHTPPVRVVTGREVGFDDFFGYVSLTPSGLSDSQIAAAQLAAQKACHALGLRSVLAHVELMKTSDGWKIIELGPRVGGYRHEIYELSYGINHIVNDVLNRAGAEPVIPNKVISHTAKFNLYADHEGILESISGLEEIRELKSLVALGQDAQIGDKLLFAKNNGDPAVVVTLSHKDASQLQADIRILERALKLKVKGHELATHEIAA
jgi:biotin carboxylase